MNLAEHVKTLVGRKFWGDLTLKFKAGKIVKIITTEEQLVEDEKAHTVKT